MPLLFLLCILIISCNNKSNTSSPPTALPTTTKTPVVLTIDSFVLDNHSILSQATTDFNADGFEDAVLILKKDKEEETSDYANNKPTLRPLLLLAADSTGSFHLIARNDKAVYCVDCGGQMGDPFSDLIAHEQYVSIQHYGGSQNRWARHLTFKYDREKKQWFLYKDAEETFNASTPVDTSNLSDKNYFNTPLDSFNIYQ